MPDTETELVVYGIPNCDQVKKARRWFDAAQCSYRFHDLRREGISSEHIGRWLRSYSWTTLVNQKGTTWRNLDAGDRPADEASAVAAMLAHPTLIKRPVIEKGDEVVVGFAEARYAELLKAR
jgi:arsenate reductase